MRKTIEFKTILKPIGFLALFIALQRHLITPTPVRVFTYKEMYISILLKLHIPQYTVPPKRKQDILRFPNKGALSEVTFEDKALKKKEYDTL